MTKWIPQHETKKTTHLMGRILEALKKGESVQFLATAGEGVHVVQRLRVALSRSRNRNRQRGKKIWEFTLRHTIYPYTLKGKRHDCIVMWAERTPSHEALETLDDLLER